MLFSIDHIRQMIALAPYAHRCHRISRSNSGDYPAFSFKE
jgi:hypothetical protein